MRSIYPLVLLMFFAVGALGQATGEYRSNVATGNWNVAGSWQSFNGAIWVAAATPPTGNEPLITIQAGHNITMPAAGNPTFTVTTQLDVATGGTLTIQTAPVPTLTKLTLASSGLIVNNGTINFVGGGTNQTGAAINGTVENSGTISSPAASKLRFNTDAVYEHIFTASNGTVPTATWAPASTCRITSSNNLAPGGLTQAFGNFEWNYPTQSALIDLAGALTTVTGDLRLISNAFAGLTLNGTGNNYLLNVTGSIICNEYFEFNAGAGITTINAGNLTVDDPTATGIAYLVLASGGGQTILNVTGDLLIDNVAGVDMSFGSSSSTEINLSGDYTVQNGGYLTYGFGSGTYELNFTGTSLQTVTEGQALDGIDILIEDDAVVSIPGDNFLGTDATFTLGSTTSSTAVLQVGSSAPGGAIQTGTGGGNIRVSGTRTYNSGATIVYNGNAAQFIGNGHPVSAGVNTQIANTSGVTLVSNITIGGELELVDLSGPSNLLISNRTLTLTGTFVPNDNFLEITSASSLEIIGTGAFGVLQTTGSTTITNFTIDRVSGGSVTLGSDLTIAGTLTQENGDIVLNSNAFTISGAYSRNNGTFFIDAASDFLINGSGALPTEIAFGGDQILNSLTINRSSSTFGTNSSFTVTNLNLLSGTFSNTGTITIATNGVITRTEGSIINNTPTAQTVYDIVYNIANDIATASEIPANDDDLRHVTKTGGAILTLSEPITINGNLTISNGVFNAATHGVDLKGNFIANSTSQLTASTFTFSGNTTVSGGAATVFGPVTITGTVMPNKNIQINGNLVNNGTLTAGTGTTTFGGTTAISGSGTTSFNSVTINASSTLTAPSGSINVGGNFTNNGTFTHSNGTIVFNGTTAIAGSSASSFNNVSITGTLTAPSSTVLSIAGNLSNSGTFNHNNGTLLLNGTVLAQAIIGAYTMNNINISNPSGINNNGNVSLIGTLSLVSAGRIDADGSGSGILTVRSTSTTEGGRIAVIATPANFTGQVTIERFVNSPAGWRYLSMPITNGNVGMWQDDFPVTGNFSNPSPAGVNNVTQSSAPSIYFWNSTTQAYVTVGSGAATGSTSLSNTVGYSPYSYMSGNFTVTVRGNPRVGATSSTIASSGFALVPNPYPSSIDWDNMNRTGLSSTVSIRVANGVFASYVAGGLATNAPFVGWTGEIAMGQSFWVESTGATSVNFAETDKTSNQYQFLREGTPENYLRIVLQSKTQQDEALIWFVDEATNGFDDLYDAKKMKNGYFEAGENPTKFLNLFTKAEDGAEYAINSSSPLSCNTTYHLKVTDVTPGDHTLLFKDMQTLKLGYQVVLVDQFLQTEKTVTDNFEYNFSITEDEASANPGRFKLRFLLPGSAYINSQVPPAMTVSTICEPSALTIQMATQPNVSYQFYNGETAITETFFGSDGDLTEIEISKDHLQPGANLFSLRASNEKVCENHVYANVIDFNFVPVEPVSITQEGAILTSNIGTSNIGEGNHQWYKDGVMLGGADGTSLEVLESGEYHLGVSFGGCMSFSQHVKVDVDALLRESYIKAYPNPVTERLIVVLPEEMDKQLNSIAVFDARGMRVTDSNIDPRLLTDVKKTIDLTHVNGGLYILQIQSADKTYRLKVIKK